MIRSQYPNHNHIFTDGSKLNDKTGYGFYDSKEKISFSGRLKSQFTITNAELVAILKALEYVEINKLNNVVILTDSKSTTQLLKNRTVSSSDNYLIFEIFNRINRLAENITIQWIPGHIGLVGNDRADNAAKLGTNRTQIDDIKLTRGDTLLNMKNETYCMWDAEYQNISQEKGRYHYLIKQNTTPEPWFKDIDLPTDLTIILSRIRTGHTATKERLYSWRLVNSPNCDSCNVTEDLPHILHHCDKYHSIRLNYPLLLQNNNITQILAENNFNKIEQIAEFIKETRVCV